MPDGETHFDVHLQDNAADCWKSFLEGIGEDALGGNAELVQTKFFDIAVDPTGFVVKEGNHDLAVPGHTALQGVGEVVGAVTFDLHTDGLVKSDAEGLGALLQHAHQFFGIFEVVVHKHPVGEMGGVLDFFINTS